MGILRQSGLRVHDLRELILLNTEWVLSFSDYMV